MTLEMMGSELVVSSHVYPFIIEVNIGEKDAQEITSKKIKFNIRDMIWHVGFRITPEKSGILFTVNRKNAFGIFQIVCSILNYPELGTITLTSDDVDNPQTFFDWKNIKKIEENGDSSMKICINFIDLTKDCNQVSVDCVMTKQLRMLRTYESGEFSDFLIKTEKKDFKVHKIILTARSSVFDAMFRSDMKETKAGVVIIKNVSTEVMEQLLLFMYADLTSKLSEMSHELFEAAHLYDVRDLQRLCVEHMLVHLSVENVTGVLNLFDKYQLQEPKEEVSKFIRDNENSIAKRDEYLIYLMETVKVENVGDRLKFTKKYELTDLKQFFLEFIAKNYKDVIKNKEYREMYRSEEWMNLMLEVDEYISDYNTNKVDAEKIVSHENNFAAILIVSIIMNLLSFLYFIFM